MKEESDAPRLEEAKKRIKEAKEKQFSTLNLSDLNLTGIPGEVFELIGLRELDLSKNQLNKLSREIGGLKNLKKLYLIDLSYNQITQLPKKFAELKNLLYLSLSNNQFTQLPNHALFILVWSARLGYEAG